MTTISLSTTDAIRLEGSAALIPIKSLELARSLLEKHSNENALSVFDAQLDATHFNKDATHIDEQGNECIVIHSKLFAALSAFIKQELPDAVYEALREDDISYLLPLDMELGKTLNF